MFVMLKWTWKYWLTSQIKLRHWALTHSTIHSLTQSLTFVLHFYNYFICICICIVRFHHPTVSIRVATSWSVEPCPRFLLKKTSKRKLLAHHLRMHWPCTNETRSCTCATLQGWQYSEASPDVVCVDHVSTKPWSSIQDQTAIYILFIEYCCTARPSCLDGSHRDCDVERRHGWWRILRRKSCQATVWQKLSFRLRFRVGVRVTFILPCLSNFVCKKKYIHY
jgi:hypothetical protein